MSELNVWDNKCMARVDSTFRCICNYSCCFEAYISMTDFFKLTSTSVFGCVHNVKQTYDSSLRAICFCKEVWSIFSWIPN